MAASADQAVAKRRRGATPVVRREKPPRAELDEEEDIKCLEQQRLDREEVAGQDLVLMAREEGTPGALPRCRRSGADGRPWRWRMDSAEV